MLAPAAVATSAQTSHTFSTSIARHLVQMQWSLCHMHMCCKSRPGTSTSNAAGMFQPCCSMLLPPGVSLWSSHQQHEQSPAVPTRWPATAAQQQHVRINALHWRNGRTCSLCVTCSAPCLKCCALDRCAPYDTTEAVPLFFLCGCCCKLTRATPIKGG